MRAAPDTHTATAPTHEAHQARSRTCALAPFAVVTVLLMHHPVDALRQLDGGSRLGRGSVVLHANKASKWSRHHARKLPEDGNLPQPLHAKPAQASNYGEEDTDAVASAVTELYSDYSSLALDAQAEAGRFESIDEFVGILEERMKRRSNAHFGSLEQSPALVLNADYQPLSLVPLSLWCWQDAIKAVFTDKVTVVATYNRSVRGASYEIAVPSVIALKDYVRQGSKKVNLTRRNMFLRDKFSCQYCGEFFGTQSLTFDHVVPRCKGGATSWDNVVAACKSCNAKKRDLEVSKLSRVGMRLLKTPHTPSFFELQNKAKNFPPKVMHESWEEYLWTPQRSHEQGQR